MLTGMLFQAMHLHKRSGTLSPFPILCLTAKMTEAGWPLFVHASAWIEGRSAQCEGKGLEGLRTGVSKQNPGCTICPPLDPDGRMTV